MTFLIIATIVSVIFFIVSVSSLINYVKNLGITPKPLSFISMMVGGCICLCVLVTYPLAVFELDRTQQELKELKEQNKIESVYEPVNEILYRKCEQE